MEGPSLALGAGVEDSIRAHARQTYPHECCGALIGREVEITSGLQPSDLVVVGGQQRLRDGVLVSATTDASTAGDSSTRGGSSR